MNYNSLESWRGNNCRQTLRHGKEAERGFGAGLQRGTCTHMQGHNTHMFTEHGAIQDEHVLSIFTNANVL